MIASLINLLIVEQNEINIYIFGTI